jgi:hypothetical protein
VDFLIWGALSDKRAGLSFAIATGHRQRSHFLVRVRVRFIITVMEFQQNIGNWMTLICDAEHDFRKSHFV